jgi:anaerobic magnesium-protoporphyrin IX monomethyl ester cyclase
MLTMDAIIIADTGSESVSATNQHKLTIEGHISTIQIVHNYLQNKGKILPPILGNNVASWSSSLKLNGIYLYSYLSSQGFEVGLIDSYFQEKIKFTEMLKQSPIAVVISTTFIMSKKTLNVLVQDIRSLAPDIFIIAGGQFVHLSRRIKERQGSDDRILNLFKEEYLFLEEKKDPLVDLYIISSTGEDQLSKALKSLKKKGNVEGVANSASYQNRNYTFSLKEDNSEAKGAVTVDWNRMPKEFFSSMVVPMQASYGCPYNCAFCNFMKDRRRMGVKPLKDLIEELKIVQGKGVKYVWFVDDNFRLGRHDLDIVCQQFIKQGIKINWKSFIRPSVLEKLEVGLLKEAGCIEVQFGLESADPSILQRMNKKANPDLYSKVIEKVLRANINCSCYFIFGFPGETQETINRTLEFIKTLEHAELDGCIYFTMFPFIIAPLSPISEPEMAKKYNLNGSMYHWEHNTMNFKEAAEFASKAFFSLKSSGVIYHGDNLDMLYGLEPSRKKNFVEIRHKLAKEAAKKVITKEYHMQSFRKVWEDLLLSIEQ